MILTPLLLDVTTYSDMGNIINYYWTTFAISMTGSLFYVDLELLG